MKTVLYPGSFDPVTLGHLDVIARAARMFDRIVIAVGVHHAKKALLGEAERLALLAEAVAPIAAESGCRIDVVAFDGLVVEAARNHGALAILRGIRNMADFDYELQMEGMNAELAPEIGVVYLAAAPRLRHIASSLVRQIAALGGPVDAFVPPNVARRLRSAETART